MKFFYLNSKEYVNDEIKKLRKSSFFRMWSYNVTNILFIVLIVVSLFSLTVGSASSYSVVVPDVVSCSATANFSGNFDVNAEECFVVTNVCVPLNYSLSVCTGFLDLFANSTTIVNSSVDLEPFELRLFALENRVYESINLKDFDERIIFIENRLADDFYTISEFDSVLKNGFLNFENMFLETFKESIITQAKTDILTQVDSKIAIAIDVLKSEGVTETIYVNTTTTSSFDDDELNKIVSREVALQLALSEPSDNSIKFSTAIIIFFVVCVLVFLGYNFFKGTIPKNQINNKIGSSVQISSSKDLFDMEEVKRQNDITYKNMQSEKASIDKATSELKTLLNKAENKGLEINDEGLPRPIPPRVSQ